MALIELFACGELAANEIRQIDLGLSRKVAIYNLDGEFFATDDTCTHGDASLAEGDIEGDEVVCPFHLGAFNIRTGEASAAPCSVALKTYPVVVENDSVFIDFTE